MVDSIQNQVFTHFDGDIKSHINEYLPKGKDRVSLGLITHEMATNPKLKPTADDIRRMLFAAAPVRDINEVSGFAPLLSAIKSDGGHRRLEAFSFIEQPGLALDEKIQITGKELMSPGFLDEDAESTSGLLALVHLLDPGNGWSRDGTHRPYMLEMASLLVEKGVRLEGVTFGRNGSSSKNLAQMIEYLARWDEHTDYGDAPQVTPQIVQRFSDAGYTLDLPINRETPVEIPAQGRVAAARQNNNVFDLLGRV